MLWEKKETKTKEKEKKKSAIVHPSQVETKPTGGKRYSLKSPAHPYDERWAHLSAAGPAVHTLAMRKQTLNQRERGSLHHQHHSCKHRCGEQEVQYSRNQNHLQVYTAAAAAAATGEKKKNPLEFFVMFDLQNN